MDKKANELMRYIRNSHLLNDNIIKKIKKDILPYIIYDNNSYIYIFNCYYFDNKIMSNIIFNDIIIKDINNELNLEKFVSIVYLLSKKNKYDDMVNMILMLYNYCLNDKKTLYDYFIDSLIENNYKLLNPLILFIEKDLLYKRNKKLNNFYPLSYARNKGYDEILNAFELKC